MLRTSSPGSSSMLDRRKDQQTSHLLLHLPASYRPGSSLRAAAGPAGNSSAVGAVHKVLQEVHTVPEVARNQGLAGMGWASRSSHCCWVDPVDMAARFGCTGQHRGGSVAATEGTAAVRPALSLVCCPTVLHVKVPRNVA
jgi:hypothetical protein